MKLFAHSLLTALLLSTATFASTATTTPTSSANPTVTTDSYKVAVFPAADSKLNVRVERAPGQAMFVSLKGADGKVLAKQTVNKKEGNFRFQFDLTNLQDGSYSVEVASGNDVTVYPVTLRTQPAQASTRMLTLN